MTRFLLACFLFVSLGWTMASAQTDQRAPRRSADERAQALTNKQHEKLAFTDDQKTKVGEINAEFFSKMDELRASNGGNRRGMMQGVQAANKARDAKTVALLSDEQKPKYEAAREEFKEMARQRMQQRKQQSGGGN
jgi:hypothetical protein